MRLRSKFGFAAGAILVASEALPEKAYYHRRYYYRPYYRRRYY